MSLIDVVIHNLRRRKGRKALLMLGMTIGAATVVALTAIMQTMNADVATKLDEYGANILIVPQANGLSLSYGGVAVASAAYDVAELTLSELERIQTIKNAKNISVVAPKLLGASRITANCVYVLRKRDSYVAGEKEHTLLNPEPFVQPIGVDYAHRRLRLLHEPIHYYERPHRYLIAPIFQISPIWKKLVSFPLEFVFSANSLNGTAKPYPGET